MADLGKLITYAAFMDARAAIWISPADPRPEHVRAISWLNESAATVFYLLKQHQGFRIGDSPPAPLLTLIVGPSDEARGNWGGEERARRAMVRRNRFWMTCTSGPSSDSKLHRAVSAGEYGWVGGGSGTRGVTFNYVTKQHGASVELYIDRGRDAEDENDPIFNSGS